MSGNNVITGSRFEWIKEFWRYKELFYFFVWRDIKIKYRQTILGALWAVIQPLFTMLVFTTFFGKFAKMPSDGIPYPIFSYVALVPWTYFSGAVSYSGNCLIGNSSLVTKVYFPRFAIPASATLSGLIDFFIASILLFALMIYYHVPLSWGLLLWPVLVLPLVLLALGLGMILASLNVKYRDIKYTIPFGISMLMFITPIIYPISILPEKYQKLVILNPLTGIIDAFRSSVFPTKHMNFVALSISIVASIVIFFVGLVYFRKTEKNFADVI